MVMDVRLWCNTGMGGGADRPDWVAMAEMAANSGFYKARIARLVHAAAVQPLGDVLLRPQDVLKSATAPRGLQATLDAGLRI